MSRFLRLYRTFVRNSLAREIEFRANFWAKVGQNVVWVMFFFLLLKIVYSRTNSVAGYSESMMYVVLGTGSILNALVYTLFSANLQEIPSMVRTGTLDYVLVKPVDSQIWVSLRKINFDSIGTSVFGIGLIIVGFVQLGRSPSLLAICEFIVLMGAAGAIFYSFEFMMMTLAIWLVRVDNLWVLGDTAFNIARWPTTIFENRVQFILTYLLPLAFLATIPAGMLLGLSWHAPKFVGIAVVWGIGFTFISRWFWRFALRYYASASS